MICQLVDGRCQDCGGDSFGAICPAEITSAELLAMRDCRLSSRAVRITPYQLAAVYGQLPALTADERAELLPGIADEQLIGSKLETLFKRLGFPPCAGCGSRRDWLNRAHAALADLFS